MVFLEDLEKELAKKDSERKKIEKYPKKDFSFFASEEKKIEGGTLEFKKPKRVINFTKLLNTLLVVSLVIFIISLGIFVAVTTFKKEPPKEFSLNIYGPLEVNSLEEKIYTISLDNFSSQDLTDVNLTVILSEGVYFANDDSKEKSFSIGELEHNTSTQVTLNLIFLNEGNKEEKVKTVLRYKLKNRNYTFETSKDYSVLVKNPPLSVIPYLPSKIFVYQPLEVSFKISNISYENLNNVKVKFNLPNEFELSDLSRELLGDQNEIFLGDLRAGESKNIVLVGKFNNVSLYPFFYLTLSFNWRGQSFSLAQKPYKLEIEPSPVVVTIETSPRDKNVYLGQSLGYTITITNRSKIPLKENIVTVTFNELFDPSRVYVNQGYYSTIDQKIYFTSRYEPKLLEIKPGESVKLHFGLNLIRSYPILGDKNKNFVSRVNIEFRTPTILPEIKSYGLGGEEGYVLSLSDEKKIIGRFEISSFIVYRDKFFNNQGPFPLVSETPTNFSLHIKIKTIGEDFENLSLKGKLFPYVNFTGEVAGDAIKENFSYDPRTGEFSYFVKSIPANTGYDSPELDLVFQITVLPPYGYSLVGLEIGPSINYQITSSFTKINFSGYLDSISSFEILPELK